jgi:hypothetical protein
MEARKETGLVRGKTARHTYSGRRVPWPIGEFPSQISPKRCFGILYYPVLPYSTFHPASDFRPALSEVTAPQGVSACYRTGVQ